MDSLWWRAEESARHGQLSQWRQKMGGVAWFPEAGGCVLKLRNDPHWFIYLNTWLPAGSTVWGGYGTLNSIPARGRLSLGVGSEVLQPHPTSSSQSRLPEWGNVSNPLTMLAPLPCLSRHKNSPFGTISTLNIPPTVASWVMAFYHNNRELTNPVNHWC